jgi:fatty acid desaturase
MPKDKTPDEVRAVRYRRARRRLLIACGFFALWWALFLLSFIPGLGWLLWVSWIAISGQMTVLYGLHEKALRKIAGRPAVDYNQLRKLEKTEIRGRGE